MVQGFRFFVLGFGGLGFRVQWFRGLCFKSASDLNK